MGKAGRKLLAMLCLVSGIAAPVLAQNPPAQRTFDAPQAAMEAFGAAVSSRDEAAMRALLGERYRRLIPPVDADIRARFLKEWQQNHAVQLDGDKLARIAVGKDGWTLPIPLVKTATGWQFDTRAGLEEMRYRRIGRNELSVIQTLLAIRDAQRDYVQADHDGDGLPVYADRLVSSEGKRDGLYWPTQAGEPPSPLGPAFLNAGRQKGSEGYHGYRYKLLTAQGAAAPGGAYDYRVGGKLFGGFAALAWPVRYGDTGVKSFMVSHDGVVYERDLGAETAAEAARIVRFDPVPGWEPVSADAAP